MLIEFIFKYYLIKISMSENFHSYTRKQIVSWVQSHTRYKFDQLKNGVFFCKMITHKFPEETSFKYNPNPLSQYECMNNLNSMKKMLNKRGMQLNLNVQTIFNSKNNFQLAKWFKSLFQPPQVNINNYSSVPKQPIASYRDPPTKKIHEQTPKKIQKDQKLKKKIESAEKSSKNSVSKMKRLSMAKSEAMFFQEKRMMRTQLKPPLQKKQKKAQQTNMRNYETQMIPKSNEFADFDDINEILYERALQQSIQGLSKIIQRVRQAANNTTITDLNEYKNLILKAIYKR